MQYDLFAAPAKPKASSTSSYPRDRIRDKARYRAKRDELIKYQLGWIEKNYIRQMLNVAKHRAKRKKMPFNLTVDDISIPTHCPILGIPLKFNLRSGKRFASDSPSLDRIISSLGYVKGNVQVVSNRANLIKADLSFEELKETIEAMYKWLRTRENFTAKTIG